MSSVVIERDQLWRDHTGTHLVVVYVPADEVGNTVWVCLSDQAGMPLAASTPITVGHFAEWELVGPAAVAA